jgi:hypothetical protein
VSPIQELDKRQKKQPMNILFIAHFKIQYVMMAIVPERILKRLQLNSVPKVGYEVLIQKEEL